MMTIMMHDEKYIIELTRKTNTSIICNHAKLLYFILSIVKSLLYESWREREIYIYIYVRYPLIE